MLQLTLERPSVDLRGQPRGTSNFHHDKNFGLVRCGAVESGCSPG